MATAPNIFIDFLTALGVPHTDAYSTAQFRSMPFRSLFGFSKLMERYGVECEGYVIADKSQLQELTPPLLAHTATGRFVIVNKIGSDTIGYESEGAMLETSAETFTNAWDGMVLLAFPRPDACEPDYAAHRRMELLTEAKKWVLMGVAAAIWAYLFVSNGLWRHLSLIGVMLIDMIGLWLTYMLLQKSKGVHTRASDRVCGVLQEGGCDSVLATKASTFFGLFGWSEVGFAYFGVSFIALMACPAAWKWLAVCNVCCLPFTFWSIWYQKFRAKAWCTLCVSVQCSLWLLFFCFLAGGWLKDIFPIGAGFWLLGACYIFALLAINALMPHIQLSSTAATDTEPINHPQQ